MSGGEKMAVLSVMMRLLLLQTVCERTFVKLMNHLVAPSTINIRSSSKTRRQKAAVIKDSVISHLFSSVLGGRSR